MAQKNGTREKEELQKRYLQYQLYKQQLSSFVEQKNALNEKLSELATTVQALRKMAQTKKGSEMWSPLGSGAFVRSDIKDTENVFVAAGAGVVLKETTEKAVEILQSRLEELARFDRDLVAEINKSGAQLERLEQELQHMLQNE